MPENGTVTLQLAFDNYAIADTTVQKTEEFSVSEMGDEKAISFSGASPSVLYGDVNLDGRVDITDAVLLNKAVANAVTLSSAARQNSDCMQDGELTSDDAVVLMQFLVHIVTNLPQ